MSPMGKTGCLAAGSREMKKIIIAMMYLGMVLQMVGLAGVMNEYGEFQPAGLLLVVIGGLMVAPGYILWRSEK